LLWCVFAGSSLEVKIETDSNDAVEIKTEADSNDITDDHPANMPGTSTFGFYNAINFFALICLHVTYMVLVVLCMINVCMYYHSIVQGDETVRLFNPKKSSVSMQLEIYYIFYYFVYIDHKLCSSIYSKTLLTQSRITQTLRLHGRIFLALSKVLGFIQRCRRITRTWLSWTF